MTTNNHLADSRRLWNHRIHQRWAGEDLTFWRLAFFPKYDPEQIIPLLNRAMDDLGISSYAVYEMFGLFDLFVRAWLPRHAMESVDQTLNDALAGQSMQLCEAFTVSKILRHWAWDDGSGGLYEPDPTVLKSPWSDERIAEIENEQISVQEKDELDKSKHIVRDLEHGDGIKFIMVVTSSVYSPTYSARLRLAQGILASLDNHDIEEPSLYEGSGFGQFIVMGRVANADFFTLRQLATAINATGIQDTARPYTFVSADEGLVTYHDRLPSSTKQVASVPGVEQLLARGESRQLEVKGSASLNWKRYIIGDKTLVKEDVILNEGLIKAIVGMLNAEGGHVVVGALEAAARFGEEVVGSLPEFAERRRIGDYVCVGVNAEYDERGWDGFRLTLLDAINARIDPSPAGSLGLDRQEVDGCDLWVVSVKPTNATWYYRYLGEGQAEQFFVREDGRTVAYAGSRADAYKRTSPRG